MTEKTGLPAKESADIMERTGCTEKTRFIHISDLHFGTEEEKLVDLLLEKICSAAPELVIVSGDFTQIGNEEEYHKAAQFLKRLNCPFLAVPGNHDIPARNLIARLFSPYGKYRKYITHELCPQIETDTFLLAGFNTARRALPHWNWANGAFSSTQLVRFRNFFRPYEERWKICVLHHPVHKMEHSPLKVKVFGGKKLLAAMEEGQVDLVLTGHVHHASVTSLGRADDGQTVYVSASTALSSRLRSQGNGYNIIDLEQGRMVIELHEYIDQEFRLVERLEKAKMPK